jgi:hypothetical protein
MIEEQTILERIEALEKIKISLEERMDVIQRVQEGICENYKQIDLLWRQVEIVKNHEGSGR